MLCDLIVSPYREKYLNLFVSCILYFVDVLMVAVKMCGWVSSSHSLMHSSSRMLVLRFSKVDIERERERLKRRTTLFNKKENHIEGVDGGEGSPTK